MSGSTEDGGIAGSGASGSGSCGPDPQPIGCKKNSDPCDGFPLTTTPWCDDRLQALPKLTKVRLIGVDGCQFYELDAEVGGMVLFDGSGFVVSRTPCLNPDQLVNYLDSEGTIIKDSLGKPIEQEPPPFCFIAAVDENGCLWKVRGKPGSAGLLQWDGENFVVGNLSVNRIEVDPSDRVDSLKLIGISNMVKAAGLLDCGEEEETQVEDVKVLDPGKDGMLHIDKDGNVTVVTACEVYTEPDEQPVEFPFIPTCSSGQPIQFKGKDDKAALLYWNKVTRQWGLIEPDDDLCDCECAEYLSIVYDCETKLFQITELPVHILSWNDSDDSGISVELNITLPWPAKVTIYGARRLQTIAYSQDVVSADLFVNGCRVTSSEDGGMVASLTEAQTSVAVAVIDLASGSHKIQVGNQQSVGNGDPIVWAGAWLKAVAHKITECYPALRKAGDGSLVAGSFITDGPGGDCDCPAGPQGIQGIQGPAGTDGASWPDPGLPPAYDYPVSPPYFGYIYWDGATWTPAYFPGWNSDPSAPVHPNGKQYYMWCIDNTGAGVWENVSNLLKDAPTAYP